MSAMNPQTLPALDQPEASDAGRRPRRFTLCVTLQCNLACDYCYVRKNPVAMSPETARRSVDFIFHHSPPGSDIEIGFFGGEPLLEFPLVQAITELIENHPAYDSDHVSLTITTNGTLFSDAIAAFLKEHDFKVCISCDGSPRVQDRFRHTAAGRESSLLVARTLVAALEALPTVLVNAVYRPETFHHLPESLEYLSGLGARQIFVNADYGAPWTRREAEALPVVYRAVADRYIDWYLKDDPHFISLIDAKLTVLLRGGYLPAERCQMGTGELTITPDGGLYGCERLIGTGTDPEHRIGSIETGVDLVRMAGRCAAGGPVNPECVDCGIRDCCMNWCGCSNAFMTGYYNRVGPFLCASERAAVQVALDVYTTLESRLGPVFVHHLAGASQWNSRLRQKGATT